MIDQKKQLIASLIDIEGVTHDEILPLIVIPEQEMGDFALPCFKFAKLLRKAPAVIAAELAKSLSGRPEFESVQAVNGYVNFKFDPLKTAKTVLESVFDKKASYADSDEGKSKTICIDYSSINVAKNFHIGHLSTTVLGSALYKIYKKLGYSVVGINHLGDYGTQFGKLICAYKLWGNKQDINERGISALTDIYVKFHAEAEKDDSLNDKAREYFKRLENGDKECAELFLWFKKTTLDEVMKIYQMLNVTFDSYNGESFFNDKMEPILDELDTLKLTSISEGARIVDLSEYDMPPCILCRADGASLYATRDLAAAFYRKNEYDFYKCLYVVAYQQNLHFKQVFKVVELMGKPWHKDLVHVPFGMVSLENEAMSTRKGNVVLLKDVLQKAIEKSLSIMEEKGIKLKDKEATAKKIGVGAVIFFALSNNRIKDIVFSFDKVLAFDGETGPYVQYTNARAKSVLRNLNEDIDNYLKKPFDKEELEGLRNKESAYLISLLERFYDILRDSIEKYEPSILTRYITDVAKAFNKFYYEFRILNGEPDFKRARVGLCYATVTVIEEGLRLLGIEAVDEM